MLIKLFQTVQIYCKSMNATPLFSILFRLKFVETNYRNKYVIELHVRAGNKDDEIYVGSSNKVVKTNQGIFTSELFIESGIELCVKLGIDVSTEGWVSPGTIMAS